MIFQIKRVKDADEVPMVCKYLWAITRNLHAVYLIVIQASA